ncbi:MAG: hypothetical protein NVSMB27_16890 [Ktedonobacteraceae bacterium]
MTKLDELLTIDGALIAFDFAADGKVLDARAKQEVSAEEIGLTAQACAAVTLLFTTLSGALPTLGGTGWLPQNGWVYCGGDRTLLVDNSCRGIIVETSKVDLNHTVEALFRCR